MSITSRLLVSASLVLTICLGSIGWLLDETYRETTQQAMQDRLQNQLYTIIAAIDLGANGRMFMPENLPEPRFYEQGSGIYAQIRSHDASQFWSSASAKNIEIPYIEKLEQGGSQFKTVRAGNNEELLTFNMGLAWSVNDKLEAFTFSAAESLYSYHQKINEYRQNLWTWMVGVGVLFLMIQAIIIRWSLSPLRKVADDLSAIERGEKSQLEGGYPKEIRGLTTNLNAFVRSEREHIVRYRNSLNDLAHSLKTPLAVLQNEVESPATPKKLNHVLSEQVDRMKQLVDYQLQKAASAGRSTLAAPISMDQLTRRVAHSILKVYQDKDIKVQIDVQSNAVFNGDKGDILEVLGNLIDNALKWSKSYVHIEVTMAEQQKGSQLKMLTIIVEDDGPGIPEEKIREVMLRGVRADEQVQGHGIGLAVVRDLVQLYHGKLELGHARYGGAKVKAILYT